MLTCADFTDRLYDEDSRRALGAEGPPPPDVADHCASCPTCRGAWAEAKDDAHALPALLREPAPAALERRIQLRLAEAGRPTPGLDWARRLASSAAVGAAAALAAAPSLPPALLVPGPLSLALMGASMALVGRAVYEALQGARA